MYSQTDYICRVVNLILGGCCVPSAGKHYIMRESTHIWVYIGPLPVEKKGGGDSNNKLHTDKVLP